MDKIGIRTIVVNFDDEQLPYLSLVQGDAKTRGFDIVICDSDGKEIPPNNDYIVELVATGSSAPDTPYANRHTIEDGKYRVMIPTEALSESGFVFLQLVFYQKSTGAVIHTIEQKCPVYRSRGQEVVESNNLYVDITALRLGIEKIEVMETAYLQVLEDEETRKSNEIKRETNEATRKSNEVKRESNETTRKSQETARKSAEDKRVIAEEERGIKFDSWDKTMEGVLPNATNTIAGVVKVDKMPTETGEITVPSVGKLEEVSAQLAQNAQQLNDLDSNKADKSEINILANEKANQTALDTETVERKAEVAVERARINNFTALATGSTTGDAELIDARIGADGVTYDNAGGAIRNQVTAIKDGGLNATILVRNGQKVEIDTLVDKTIKFPAGTYISHKGRSYTLWTETVLSLEGKGLIVGIYINTVNSAVVLQEIKRPPSETPNLILLGCIHNNTSSSFDSAVLNCNSYTINGRAAQPYNSIETNHMKALTKQGYMMVTDSINFNFNTNKIYISGQYNYIFYSNQLYIVSDTEVDMSINTQANAVVFDTKDNTIKCIGINSAVGEQRHQYAMSQDYIILGLIQRGSKSVNVNCNNVLIDGISKSSYEYIPTYLKEEINRVSTKVSKIDSDLTFSYATDVHLNRYADITYKLKVIGELGKTGVLNFNCLGGDIIDGGENKDSNINRLIDGLKYSKDSYPTDLFICQGNHDTGWEAFYDETWGFGTPSPETVITPKNWHNIACRHLEDKVVFDEDNYFGGYYYKDYEHAKIRVININSSDVYELDENGNPILNSMSGYLRQQQIDWIQHKALNFMDKPDRQNWGVIVLSHMSIASGDMGGLAGRNTLAGILSAYVNGTTYSDTEQLAKYTLNADVDFTSQGAMEFICSVSGHVHWDRVFNIPTINRPAISVVNFNTSVPDVSLPEGATQPERIAGTVSGEAFDIFSIDRTNRKIYATRFGAGNDRVIDY